MVALVLGASIFIGCRRDNSLQDPNSTTQDNSTIVSDDAVAVTAARSGLLLENTFEGSPFTGFTIADHQYCCDYSITQVTAPDGNGKSLKYTLNSTDAIVSSSMRAEIQLAGTDAPETSERWYGLRYWLQKYDADGGAESILQWHDKDGSTPPLSIQVQNGKLNVCQSFSSGNTHYDLGASTIGKWINIVMHVKWTTGSTGVLEVWKDGTKIVSKTNVRTNSSGGSYMKIGINKWSWAPGGGSSTATQRIFYIDDFRMGNETATFADVDPTGSGTTTPPVTPPATNQTPVVNAGNSQTITMPVSSVTLSGTASDPDGTIASYQWTKVAGSGGTIMNPTTASTSITGLSAGSYTYNLKVTDNNGATANSSVAITVNSTTTPPPTGGGTRLNLVLDNSFDASPFTGFSTADHQYCCDYSITQVASPNGSGKVLKYTLNKTDATVSSSKRAEIQLSGTDAPETSERWYGLRYYLQNYTSDGGAESILQWHDKDGTTPPLSIQVQNGRLNMTQSFTSGNTHLDMGASTSGQWISIVIHVKWTTGNTGVLEVWRDGSKIISKTNVKTNSRGGSYMKLGINKWSWAPGGGSSSTSQRIFYIDDFRMGNEKATYNDVAP